MYKKSASGILKHFDFVILDLLSLLLAMVFGYFIRFGTLKGATSVEYITMTYVMLLIDIGLLAFLETLKNVLKRPTDKELYITTRHVVFVMAAGILFLFIVKASSDYSRILIVVTIALYWFFSFFTRYLWKKVLVDKLHSFERRSLLIITSSEMLDDVLESTNDYSFLMYKVTNVVLVDKEHIDEVKDDIHYFGVSDDLIDTITRDWIDEVLVVLQYGSAYPNELIDKCMEAGITVHTSLSRLSSVSDKKQFVDRIGTYDVLTTSSNYFTTKQMLIKRATDILGGLVGCFLTFIIFIFIAPIIYISSPGPIFFKQERVGQNGKKFKIYKFRSMYMDAEERKKDLMAKNKIADGMMFKMDFDPRIIGNKELPNGKRKTGIGQFIRATSLDEFPQFFNVLKGDMSIVGTRPPTVDEWEKYEVHHRSRLAVKPGVTGMWQTSGRSDITDFEEVIRLDNEYIRHWDIWLDLRLILKTIKVIIKREGSQ